MCKKSRKKRKHVRETYKPDAALESITTLSAVGEQGCGKLCSGALDVSSPVQTSVQS